MTEQELLALSERERDALVAEKVMGWKEGTLALYQEGIKERGHGKVPGFDPIVDEITGEASDYFLGHFTTSISGAWTVVEKMASERFALSLYRLLSGQTEVIFKHYTENGWPDKVVDSIAPTEPLAICIAALKAKGVIVG